MNARQERLPSPVKQHVLQTSPLKGMERSVRSFKSFVRSVPPKPSPQDPKPLPPTPTTPNNSILTPTSLQPASESSERNSIATSWRAPAEWEWDQTSPSRHSFPTSSLFSARDYSLLLPESSPGAGDLPVNSATWLSESSVLPPPQIEHLMPIQQGSTDRSNLPSRHPSTPSSFIVISTESAPGIVSTSIEYPQPHPLPEISTSASFPDVLSDIYLQAPEVPPSNFSYRVSDASTKARAFASLGIGSPRNSEIPSQDWKNKEDPPQQEDDDVTNLTIHSKKTHPNHQEHTKLDSGLEDDEVTKKLQLLSFAQDYHQVLTERYHESDRHGQNQQSLLPNSVKGSDNPASPQSNAPSKDHELFPPPLTWKKDSKNPSPASSSQHLPYQTRPVSKPRRRKHKRIISWVHLPQEQQRKRHHTNQDIGECSIDEPMVSPRKQIPVEVDKLLMKDIRLPDLLAHTRRRVSPREHRKAAEPKDTDQNFVPTASSSPSRESPSSVLRLPGGFAIVRQASSDAPNSHTASTYEDSTSTYTLQKGSRPSSNASLPVSTSHASHASQHHLSQYSQQSQALVVSTVAVKRLHDLAGSTSSPLSRSNNSTPSTFPLAHEMSLPRTPPPIPASPPRPSNPPRVSSPLSYEHETLLRERYTENDEDHSTPMYKILDKAKGARDAWKKHQQDVKHEKLKQSIRVLGPTDPAVTAGYVRREGRSPGEGSIDSSRMPGYMVTGPV